MGGQPLAPQPHVCLIKNGAITQPYTSSAASQSHIVQEGTAAFSPAEQLVVESRPFLQLLFKQARAAR